MSALKDYIAQWQSGDDAAYDRLFRAMYTPLCRTAFQLLSDKQLAEDVVQEFFIQLWDKKDNLNITSTVEGYMKRAVINRSLNYLKVQKNKTSDLDIDIESNRQTIDQKLEQDEHRRAINHCVGLLPERRRQVFILYRFEDMRYAAIAEQLAISVKTVEVQLRQARLALRECLRKELKDFLPMK